MKKLLTIFAAGMLSFSFVSCDFGGDDETDTAVEEEMAAEPDETAEEDGFTGVCEEGQTAGFVKVRIADNEDNATLKDCNTNPGADIDAIVIVKGDGTEEYAATVADDPDMVGGICPQNDKDDVNTVLGVPDACAKDLGCGCGDDGYDRNPDCTCDNNYVGYYSLNGSAIIVGFDAGVDIGCKDLIRVYEMYNPEVAGSQEAYKIFYGDAEGNWSTASDVATGNGEVEVVWTW